ncbi:MAG: ribosome-associated translation inhibitor RaiA [Acidobacteria bacterium]|nr:ribosome-associated translation inhibitor RaiA [Acidobacteriota bacterium]
MTITIHTHGLDLTDGIHEHVHRRLRYALGRFSDKLTRIVVRLSDENGPRGGVDKRCLVTVGVPGQPDVVVKASKSDLFVAVDRAANGAWRSLVKRLKRLRGHR